MIRQGIRYVIWNVHKVLHGNVKKLRLILVLTKVAERILKIFLDKLIEAIDGFDAAQYVHSKKTHTV